MTITVDQKLEYREGIELEYDVYQSTKIFAGCDVCVNAAGYLVMGGDISGQIYQGVSREYVDNSDGSDGDLKCKVRRRGLVKRTLATAITIANVGDNVFLAGDNTVDVAGNVTYGIFCGIIAGFIDTTHAWIDIEPAIRQADVATHIADASGAHAASAISIADAGEFTENDETEAVLQEILQHLKSAQGTIDIPMPVITNAGVALAAFADADDPLPGFCVTAEGLGIRWNNHGTPTPVGAKVLVPPDADITANMTLNILAAKTGATQGDATEFTVEAFNNVVNALYDADADFGGDTTAMTGDATAKTVQNVTLTLALANLAAYPAAMELTIQPKDGTLGTDDVIMLKAWITYKKKLLAS
jgi:hypothetical protein